MKKNSILIIGAGEAGQMLFMEYKKRSRDRYVVGFLDDDPQKIKKSVCGKPVIDSILNLRKTLLKFNIEEVVVAIPSASKEIIQKIIHDVTTVNNNINIYINC